MKNNSLLKKIIKHKLNKAIIYNDIEINYRELYNLIIKYINSLKEKILVGDIVAIIGDYSINSIAMFFALSELKAIIVPLTTIVKKEVDEKLYTSNVKWCIKFIKDIHDLNNYSLTLENENNVKNKIVNELCNKKKSGLILFSSGSTGKPKAMLHDLDNLIKLSLSKKIKRITFMVFLMFDHIGGINTFLNVLSMGSVLILTQNRNPETICCLIEKHKVNVLPTSPTFLNLILISKAYIKYSLSSLRIITYGTEAMPEQLLIRIKKAIPNARLLQSFGTSETGIAQTVSKGSNNTVMKIDDPNTLTKIVKNELWIKSKAQIIGYLNKDNNKNFTDDGWFKTGDLVENIGNGFFKIKGRTKEQINVGGEKVLPIEVENVLLNIKIVDDCMVYGESSPIIGQCVVADIVLDKNTIDIENAKIKIKKHCISSLDRYKVPVKINFVKNISYGNRFKKIRKISVKRQ